MTLMARLSADAYNPVRKRKSVEGWSYIPEQSSTYHAVYYEDGGQNRAVVASRGTKPTDVADLEEDLRIIMGRGENSPRVKNALRIGKRIERQTDREVTYTGHSLSAQVAYFAARKHKREAHAFNLGSSPASLLRETGRMVKCGAGFTGECVDDDTSKRLNVYHNSADPLSVASYYYQAQHHETPSSWTGWDAHGLKQYGVPDEELIS
jgi:hypothetical protein